MYEVIRQRRAELGLSQADLAAAVGVDKRQIRRYEAGETQPTIGVALALSRALDVSVEELAGQCSPRVDLSGEWWACWQSWKDNVEVINPHEVSIRQQGSTLDMGQRDRYGLVRSERSRRSFERHHVLCAPSARPAHDRPLGRPQLRRSGNHWLGDHGAL